LINDSSSTTHTSFDKGKSKGKGKSKCKGKSDKGKQTSYDGESQFQRQGQIQLMVQGEGKAQKPLQGESIVSTDASPSYYAWICQFHNHYHISQLERQRQFFFQYLSRTHRPLSLLQQTCHATGTVASISTDKIKIL
jgi:hypothetical protein